MSWWTDLDVLNRLAFWLTVLAVASPFVLGLAALVVQKRAKILEDQRVESLTTANQELQRDLGESRLLQNALHGQIRLLEKEQHGRVLTEDQVRRLAAALKARALTERAIYLEALQGDREAIQLAKSIKQAFDLAGFQVDGVHEELRIAGTGPSIQIWYKPHAGHAGTAINAALAEIGLESKTLELTKPSIQNLVVIVGYRP